MTRFDAIDIPLQLATTGEPITLRELMGGQLALVILTRHMDCPFCEVYLRQVTNAHHDLGRVIVVGHGTPDELAVHHSALPHEFVVVADAEHALYDALRMRRLRSALGLRIRWSSVPTLLRHFAQRQPWVRPGQDLLQLGGDAIVDPDIGVRWLHFSRQPDDRPTMRELQRHMHRAA
ncbi:MAG: prostamide/prostaglandin synthase-like [Thermoleophilia bacterium]|nr:prostamide/prostaglandin synthase-like [Thermoleophilia bacterium]